jgi:hypothetical protein
MGIRVLTYATVAAIAVSFVPDDAAQVVGSVIGGQGVPGTVTAMYPGGPSAAITGSIVDEEGRPLPRVMVQAWMETTTPDGVRRQMGGGGMRATDDQGRFSLERIPPGDYVVAVVPSPAMRGSAETTTYPVTYYPGVTSLQQAQKVTAVVPPTKDITLALRRVKAFHVRGTVSSSTGRSTQGLQVQAAQRFGYGRMPRGTGVVGPDGRFDIGGLASGPYTLSARVSMNTDSSTDFVMKEIDVVSGDLDGVELALRSGGTINGRIVFETPVSMPAPLDVSVMTAPAFTSQNLGMTTGQVPRPAAVGADWTFQIRGLSGQYHFNLQMQALPDYAVVRTVLDGRDIGGMLDASINSGMHELIVYVAQKPEPMQ